MTGRKHIMYVVKAARDITKEDIPFLCNHLHKELGHEWVPTEDSIYMESQPARKIVFHPRMPTDKLEVANIYLKKEWTTKEKGSLIVGLYAIGLIPCPPDVFR